MALHFYFGGAGSGKSFRLYEEIIQRSMAEPDVRFLVLVPEQFTMETQRTLVRLHPRHAILNIEVLSLTRLAWRVFSETGGSGEAVLEEIGKTFLLEKLALEERRNLKWFGSTLHRPEDLAEMKAMLSELLLYGITPEMLLQAAGGENPATTKPVTKQPEAASTLQLKLRDLAHIERCFTKKLAGSYMTMEELPRRLAKRLPKSQLVRNSVVVLDGFTGFTPLQEELFRTLLPLTADCYLALTIDPERNPFGFCPPNDLFFLSAKTASFFRGIAEEAKVPVGTVTYLDPDEKSRHAASRDLQDLEERLFRPGRRGRAERKNAEEIREIQKDRSRDIHIFAAANPREEMEEIARSICRLVREDGLRYREIAVICSDPERYRACARRIFDAFDIPCFIDEKRELIRNPWIEYIRALLEMLSESYSYEAVFRMLKTGLSPLADEEVMRLENHALAMRIRGKKKWHERFIRHYRGQDPAEVPELEEIREKFIILTDPVAEAFAKRGSTVREKTEALMAFLAGGRAEERLEEERLRYLETGRPDLAREYAQVWPYLTSFTEKLCDVLGEERISVRDYRALLEAGFHEARVAIIPPGNDRVIVGDAERTRLPGVRVLFYAGMNEGLVPKAPAGGGVLTEADRRQLEDTLRLKPSAKARLYIDRFYLYQTLTKPSEQLILSYAENSSAGDTQHPSYVIGTLRELFPDLNVRKIMEPEALLHGFAQETRTETEKRDGAEDLSGGSAGGGDTADGLAGAEDLSGESAGTNQENIRLPETEAEGLTVLAGRLAGLDERPLTDADLQLFAYYRFHPHYAEDVQRLLDAAALRRGTDRISRAAARMLYGMRLVNSATRLEHFASCQAAHFYRYGLGLREREEYAFSGLDLGNILHRALELYADKTDGGRHFAEVSADDEQCRRYASLCITEATREESSVLFDSARDAYQKERMERLLRQSIKALGTQLAAGDFHFGGAEESFGERLELPDGAEMYLTGRIDRMDLCEDGDRTLLRIIDYKTGSTSFDPAKIGYGLQLQLTLYLAAAADRIRQRGGFPEAAGMQYYNVQDPLISFEELPDEDELRSALQKKLIGSGVVSSDPEVLRRLDRSFGPGYRSEVIPAGMKADGDFYAGSSVLDPEDFALLMHYVRKKSVRTAEEMYSGAADANPYFYKHEQACTYCPYRAVCGFDRAIPGCAYRFLPALKKEEVLALMQRELGVQEDIMDGAETADGSTVDD